MKQNKDMKQFTTLAILVAVTVVLQTLSATMLKFFAVPVSLVMIPVAVSVILYGVKGGAIVGGAFGITVFVHGLTGLDAATNLLLTDPKYGDSSIKRIIYVIIVIFVRCLLAGIAAGILNELVKKIKNKKIKYGLTGFLTPLCNTCIFIVLYLLLYYSQTVAQAAEEGHSHDWFAYFILTVVAFNFTFEAVTTTLLVPPICIALEKTKNK